MHIFLDTADVAAISKHSKAGLISGVTTNPTHLSAAGGNPRKKIEEICAALPDGLISVEITESNPEKAYAQAHQIARISPNILVKIPCHARYYEIIRTLVDEEIRLNVTLLFSMPQAICMAKLGVDYISPFVGRLDDLGVDGITLLEDIRHAFDQHAFDTNILAASLRHIQHVQQAILAGADAITVPVPLFEKMIHHPLTDQGMAQFDADWQKLGISQFP